MSNYPPTPSFGGPFNFAPQWPSTAPNVPSPIPHNPHEPDKAPAAPPPPPSTLQPFLGTNVSNFNLNTQIPRFVGNGVNIPPPPFPFLSQFPNSTLPPPPFPPVPIPQIGFPSILPPTIEPQHQAETPIASTSVPSQNAIPIESQIQNFDASPDTSVEDLDREEGELSDRELEEKSPTSAHSVQPHELPSTHESEQMGPKRNRYSQHQRRYGEDLPRHREGRQYLLNLSS